MPKKVKKKPKPPEGTHKPTTAAKKKEVTDTKKSEIKQLQDSLSSFFTPTSSRRARQPPPPILPEDTPENDFIEQPHSSGEQQPPTSVIKSAPSKSHGTTEIAAGIRSTSRSSPEPCSSKTTTAAAVAVENAAVENAAERKKKNACRKLPKQIIQKRSESLSSQDDRPPPLQKQKQQLQPPPPLSLPVTRWPSPPKKDISMPNANPQYWYKGFYFRPCQNAPSSEGGVGPKELIESIKIMERINRENSKFKPFDIESCSEYEEEPWPTMDKFKDAKEYEKYCRENPRKIVKVMDGLTRAQRREHRQFALEFEELLNCLRANHMVYCDDPFKEYTKPFNPPQPHILDKQHILQRAKQKHENEILLSKLKEKQNNLSDISSTSSESSDTDEELVDFRQRFSKMDLKPIVVPPNDWRDLLPPKPMIEGAAYLSSESSDTTDLDEEPKPLTGPSNNAGRPHEYSHYRSDNERILYRRYVRRACRKLVLQNKRKDKVQKFLQIGSHKPKRELEIPTTIKPIFEDPGLEIISPECIGYKEIMAGLSEAHRELLTKHFEKVERRGAKRVRKYEKTKFPVPRLIYTRKFCMKTLHTSAFPDPMKNRDELFICDLCLGGFLRKSQYENHVRRCSMTDPPGRRIYYDKDYRLGIYEIDGVECPTYCQMLCCWSKCYIEHKSLSQDLEPFLFYVLAKKEKDTNKSHFIGYFSKQKYGHSLCNLCCLLVLPCYQGKGYGRFLVDLSFLLSRVEGIPGTPERPLSDAADYMYYKYYVDTFYETAFAFWRENLKEGKDFADYPFTLKTIEERTGINRHDLLCVLHSEGIADLIHKSNDPNNTPDLRWRVSQQTLIDHMNEQMSKKTRLWIKPKYLKWKPSFNTVEEMLHFPLIQAEHEAREAGLLDGLSEGVLSPPKPKKGRRKKGEKKVSKAKKVVMRFNRNDTTEEFNENNKFDDITRSQVFASKDHPYLTLPFKRPSKKTKRRPVTTTLAGKRRKSIKKKQSKDDEDASEDELTESDLSEFEDDKMEANVAEIQDVKSVKEEEFEEDGEPNTPPKRKATTKLAKKPLLAAKKPAKKKSPPKRRGRKPACKDKSLEEKLSSSDNDSDEDNTPGPSGRPIRKKSGTTPKTPKDAQGKNGHVDRPRSCVVMSEMPKNNSTPKIPKDQSSDEEGCTLRVNVLDDYHSTSDSDDQLPPPQLPQRPPVGYHTFSPHMEDSFQEAMSILSPRRSNKRSSRNRSVSFSRSAKECKQTTTTTTASDCYDSAPNLHQHEAVINMEFGPNVNAHVQHQGQQESSHRDELYPYSNRSAKSIPGKEEMPKLLPTTLLKESMERMETNDANDNESDDDDDDDAPPPLLSPKLATNYGTESPAEELGERGFQAASPHSSEPTMDAPPMLTNASVPTNESAPSHRGPESLQNAASRRSSTEMQQSHSVPNQSISHPQQMHQNQMQQQTPQHQQLPIWQQQIPSNEMYNMQPTQQMPQQQPHQLQQHVEQPHSHPQQQMTPQQPPSMAMSDPNSVYSMPSAQSQQSGVPSHPMPQQMQLNYPPVQEIMKPVEPMLMPHPQQQQPQQHVEKPKPKQKRQPKKKESTASLPSTSAGIPMLSQQRYPNPYDAQFNNLFQPYVAAAQMAQFPTQGGYPSYPNHYPSSVPNPMGYPQQQFNPSFNPWTNQPAAAYSGYPSFIPPMAAAAAAAQQNSSKFYSQMTAGYQQHLAAAIGGGGSGSSTSATPNPMNPMIPNPAAAFQQQQQQHQQPTNAAAAAAAATAAANWQRTQNLNPYDFSTYQYNNLT